MISFREYLEEAINAPVHFENSYPIIDEFEEADVTTNTVFQYVIIKNPLFIAANEVLSAIGKSSFDKNAPDHLKNSLSNKMETLKLRKDKIEISGKNVIGGSSKYNNLMRILAYESLDIPAIIAKGTKSKKISDTKKKKAQDALSSFKEDGYVKFVEPQKVEKKTTLAYGVKDEDGNMLWLPKSRSKEVEGFVIGCEGWIVEKNSLPFADKQSLASYKIFAEREKRKAVSMQAPLKKNPEKFADTYKKAVGSAEKEERRVLKILLPDTPKYFKGAVIPYGRGMKVELVKVLSSQYCTEDMPSLYGSQLLGHEGETCYWWEIREV